MRAIYVDDEELILKRNVSLLKEVPEITDAEGFLSAQDALSYLEKTRVDLCLIDIDMPSMNGIELAARIKALQNDVSIIFVTGYSEYAVEAFSLHATGYLLKPVSRERFFSEVGFALSGKFEKEKENGRILVKTFGGFDVFIDGKLLTFKRSRAKELLAYLVDRRGSSVTAANAFSTIYEDLDYNRSKQKQFYVIIHSLKKTLSDNDISDIFEMSGGTMRIVPEKLDCDLYRFLDGDMSAISAFRGEYMTDYSWASITEAFIAQKTGI